ncbi:MAG: hypothetical protein ABJF11_17375 [Reichenbachiella sp.]|uniref:hypothetical protein n=1 Tax=Reichenbachiella sp. TaxID=2184521 RepID=UPI0032671130
MKKGCIVYIYNSFRDPLFQNLMLQYIKTLAKEGVRFHLITFEQPQYAIANEEQIEIKKTLAKEGIHWHPFVHRTGRFLIVKKLIDLLSVSLSILRLKLSSQVDSIFAFANVAASHSVIYSKLLGLNLYIYSYEPHAAFLAELGIWNVNGLKYRLLNFFERLAAKNAKVVFTGTKYGVELIQSISPNTKAVRLPTSVDEEEFRYRGDSAQAWKEENQVTQRDIILYIGKFGDLYYPIEKLVSFYEALHKLNSNYFFVLVTSLDLSIVHACIQRSTIPKDSFYIDQNVSNEMVKVLISAADAGMSIVPPLENQKYRSPTKVAEYLLCGLPYVTCRGVSEDDLVAEKEEVGVVISDLDATAAPVVHSAVQHWTQNRDLIREKCRAVGVSYRGKSNVDKVFRETFFDD